MVLCMRVSARTNILWQLPREKSMSIAKKLNLWMRILHCLGCMHESGLNMLRMIYLWVEVVHIDVCLLSAVTWVNVNFLDVYWNIHVMHYTLSMKRYSYHCMRYDDLDLFMLICRSSSTTPKQEVESSTSNIPAWKQELMKKKKAPVPAPSSESPIFFYVHPLFTPVYILWEICYGRHWCRIISYLP